MVKLRSLTLLGNCFGLFLLVLGNSGTWSFIPSQELTLSTWHRKPQINPGRMPELGKGTGQEFRKAGIMTPGKKFVLLSTLVRYASLCKGGG